MVQQLIDNVIEHLKGVLAEDIADGNNLNVIIDAYNKFVERGDSSEYILSVQSNENLILALSKGWVDAKRISELYANHDLYPFFTIDGKRAVPMAIEEAKAEITRCLGQVLYEMFSCIAVVEGESPYGKLYRTYISRVL